MYVLEQECSELFSWHEGLAVSMWAEGLHLAQQGCPYCERDSELFCACAGESVFFRSVHGWNVCSGSIPQSL